MMRRAINWCLMVAALLCAQTISGEPARTTASTVLSVSIAAPAERGQRYISLSTADPHFDVVVRNETAKAQQVWAEDNSAGYDNLTLEITAVDDRPLAPPVVVRRVVGNWFRNHIHTVTLEPGDTMVREVHLTKDNDLGAHYQNFPAMKAGDSHKVRMRAVFTSSGEGFGQLVWSGRAESKTEDYQVWQFYP